MRLLSSKVAAFRSHRSRSFICCNSYSPIWVSCLLIHPSIGNFIHYLPKTNTEVVLTINERIVLFPNYHDYIASKCDSSDQTSLDCPVIMPFLLELPHIK